MWNLILSIWWVKEYEFKVLEVSQFEGKNSQIENYVLKTIDHLQTWILLYNSQNGFLLKNKYLEEILMSICEEMNLNYIEEALDLVVCKIDTSLSLREYIRHHYENFTKHMKNENREQGYSDFLASIKKSHSNFEIRNSNLEVVRVFWISFSPLFINSKNDNLIVLIKDLTDEVKDITHKISENVKTIMFCTLSHEFRSPLNHINGVFSLMKNEFITSEQLVFLKIAESSIELLRLKIDDMLDFYELETNNFQQEKVKFDVRNQWRELESLFMPLIDKSLIKIYFFVSKTTPKFIVHDAERIHQILVNLIGNAVKYTKTGVISVVIDWNVDSIENEKGTVRYAVSDSGQGIVKSKRKNIFKFLGSAENNSNNITLNTTSLANSGLSFWQKLSENLGSEIKFVSTVGVGSKFWFELDINEYHKPKDDELEIVKKNYEELNFEDIQISKKRRSSLFSLLNSGIIV